jgi:GDP-4-dehydro-6-deoxy-D-mannose reductase
MKKILITGATGFAGSYLADYLLEKGDAEIYALKRTNSRFRSVAHIKDKIKWIDGDLIDLTSIINVIKKSQPDEIYHLAALSWVTPSWDMPAAYMQVNAMGTINLFEAVRILGLDPRIVVTCTPEEVGDVPEELIPITEETRYAPANHYAASKVAQNSVCQSYAASYNMKIIRTRAFNHEGGRRDITGALASFAYQIAKIEEGKQDPIIKVGNLEAKRTFMDARDVARAYALAMEKCDPGELYLIGSQNIYTIKECLEKLIELSTKKDEIKYEVDPERVRPTELKIQVGSAEKFINKTGWKPEISFEDMLKGILDYWRNFVKKDLY